MSAATGKASMLGPRGSFLTGPNSGYPFISGGRAFRILKGQAIRLEWLTWGPAGDTVYLKASFVYDDGTIDEKSFTQTVASPGLYYKQTDITQNDGWLVNVYIQTPNTPNSLDWGAVFIAGTSAMFTDSSGFIAQGYFGNGAHLVLGQMEPRGFRATYVFQGTVAEDATVGTHVCTLTVTPGAGNELNVLYGFITVGNTATAQVTSVLIDDGTNILDRPLNQNSTTTANLEYSIQVGGMINSSLNTNVIGLSRTFVSGTMRLILKVSTAAVSVTQTFAIVCRLKGTTLPTATLADSVGTPTLTTNTNRVFG